MFDKVYIIQSERYKETPDGEVELAEYVNFGNKFYLTKDEAKKAIHKMKTKKSVNTFGMIVKELTRNEEESHNDIAVPC